MHKSSLECTKSLNTIFVLQNKRPVLAHVIAKFILIAIYGEVKNSKALVLYSRCLLLCIIATIDVGVQLIQKHLFCHNLVCFDEYPLW